MVWLFFTTSARENFFDKYLSESLSAFNMIVASLVYPCIIGAPSNFFYRLYLRFTIYLTVFFLEPLNPPGDKSIADSAVCTLLLLPCGLNVGLWRYFNRFWCYMSLRGLNRLLLYGDRWLGLLSEGEIWLYWAASLSSKLDFETLVTSLPFCAKFAKFCDTESSSCDSCIWLFSTVLWTLERGVTS